MDETKIKIFRKNRNKYSAIKWEGKKNNGEGLQRGKH